MKKKKLKILLLFDLPFDPSHDEDYLHLIKTNPEYRDEKDVLNALKSLEHQVTPYGIYADLNGMIKKAQTNAYDLVFLMCETFENDRSFAPNLVSVLEMLGVKYTGANSTAQQICRDKGLSKKILAYHNIRVPQFEVSKKTSPLKKLATVKYPVIVKPLELEASEGISNKSVVKTEREALERAKFIHKNFKVDAIIEEFIEGREMYIGVMGNNKTEVFLPQELRFKNLNPRSPQIASYRAKWDDAYRKKHGIDTRKATGLSQEIIKEMQSVCKEIYQLFKISGYARIDLRLSEDGELFFLEANPNPAINKIDDFAKSASLCGVSYKELIDKIVNLGLAA